MLRSRRHGRHGVWLDSERGTPCSFVVERFELLVSACERAGCSNSSGGLREVPKAMNILASLARSALLA